MNSFDEIEIREEKVNMFTHALGVLFGLISIPILLYQSMLQGNETITTGTGIYGACFLIVFLSSTLFHFQGPGKLRERLKVLDHISIYFMIAGTYTPFILIFVNNDFGMRLLYILWGLTALGVIFKLFYTGKLEWLSIIVYLAMGWMLFSDGATFFQNMPSSVVALIIAGGVLYTLGVLFYAHRWFTYHHAVWHIFSLSGAICHYIAVAISV